jgi:hypothetical protein
MQATIEFVQIKPEYLLIRDAGGAVSVENDAAGVVEYLYHNDFLDDLKLFVLDADGNKCEWLHDGNGLFTGVGD